MVFMRHLPARLPFPLPIDDRRIAATARAGIFFKPAPCPAKPLPEAWAAAADSDLGAAAL